LANQKNLTGMWGGGQSAPSSQTLMKNKTALQQGEESKGKLREPESQTNGKKHSQGQTWGGGGNIKILLRHNSLVGGNAKNKRKERASQKKKESTKESLQGGGYRTLLQMPEESYKQKSREKSTSVKKKRSTANSAKHDKVSKNQKRGK